MFFKFKLPVAAALAVIFATRAQAQTILVNTADDTTDFGGAMQVADLPGPDGKISLAEAAMASDNTPGVQTIGFNVPQSEWTYQWLYPGRAVLNPFGGIVLFDNVILDGTTQTTFTGDTNPSGAEVVLWSPAYLINNVGSVVKGFSNSTLGISGGSGNVIQSNSDCAIEVFDGSANNLIGGTSPGQGNIGGGHIKLVSTSNNVAVGNTARQVRVLGNGPFQPPTTNNRIGGPTLAERNFITGNGTLSSHFIPSGMAVEILQASDTLLENNWIGTTPDGLSQGNPYTTIGVMVWDDNHNTTIRDNRIAGIRALASPSSGASYYVGAGIMISGSGSGVTVQGNSIGLNANDQPVLGSVTGILLVNDFYGPVNNIVIGGNLPGEGNHVAGNDREGITVNNSYSGVRISGNSIHDNGALGIELINSGFTAGVTPNDALDLDTGANGLQNFPVLQTATLLNGTLTVVGTLDSHPLTNYRVEFFASPQCDPSGFGEGQVYLGSTSVVTNVNGSAGLNVPLASTGLPGWFVTATATDIASGSTSEFSACVPSTGSAFTIYCTAKTNSLGCVPTIAASGAPSMSNATAFTITASNVLNRQNAMFFYGYATSITPFQGGFKCMSNPTKRTPIQNSGGSASPVVDCSGTYSIDFSAWLQTGIDPMLAVGQQVNGQYWSRDAASPSTTGLTDAIQFVILQ